MSQVTAAFAVGINILGILTTDQDTENPVLPEQIKVEIPQGKMGRDLQLKSTAKISSPLSSSEELVSIGCGLGSDLNEMPTHLNVDTIILCGELNYEGLGFKYVANHIILKSLKLQVKRQEGRIESASLDFIPSMIYLNTKKLTLIEDSHIQLEGYATPSGRSHPLSAMLTIYSFGDSGNLKITSLPAFRRFIE